ncbi:MAG: YitT family protein [Butyricimonas faecihominis]
MANIFHKWTHRPLAQLQMTVDFVIVLFGFLMFQDWKVPMYSWLSIFLMGKTIDMILQGFTARRVSLLSPIKSKKFVPIY